MSWQIERDGRVAVVTMNTNKVNAQNQEFFADLHEAFDTLEREHADSPVVLTGQGGCSPTRGPWWLRSTGTRTPAGW
jgi:enoyl-CoA hydratase